MPFTAQIHTANSRTNNSCSTSLWKLAGKDNQFRFVSVYVHSAASSNVVAMKTMTYLHLH
eukprot:6722278-Ditylum_brightwellii.AAC.1